jgi:hypothetical protein
VCVVLWVLYPLFLLNIMKRSSPAFSIIDKMVLTSLLMRVLPCTASGTCLGGVGHGEDTQHACGTWRRAVTSFRAPTTMSLWLDYFFLCQHCAP